MRFMGILEPVVGTRGYYYMLYILLAIACIFGVYIFLVERKVKRQSNAYKEALLASEAIQEQLEDSLVKQRELAREMIAQEKLASLGSMVAGIAHEVNNPLGVCLTTITAYDRKIKTITKAYIDEKLSKTQLMEFLETSEECNSLIHQNINNAILTINGFRVMAVNQMQDRREPIDLLSFLEVLKEGLKYELKKKRVDLNILCKDAVVFKGDPGTLTQIFTNLILNSILHGFVKDQENNLITIKLAKINSHLIIEYSDNGVGIHDDIIPYVFNMFYTTRRAEGGSGLGLHIVKDLLKEKFGGSITCINGKESGVIFTIEMPY